MSGHRYAAVAIGAAWLLLALACPPARAGEVSDPKSPASALWNIVASCIDQPLAPGTSFCACPAFARTCCGDTRTPDDEIVWRLDAHFVAIRDIKECGCGAGFVAGLAMPRTRITGIEDPLRPDAIWPFAWDVARAHIADEREIGLAINPDGLRSQDQMHVHLLRLDEGVRAMLDAVEIAADGARLSRPPALVVPLPDLDHVFTTAVARIGAAEIGAHGILVARARDAGYLAVFTDRTSPQVLTQNHCR